MLVAVPLNLAAGKIVSRPGQGVEFTSSEAMPFSDSVELVRNSRLVASALIEVGNDHRLADPEPLQAMLRACETNEGAA